MNRIGTVLEILADQGFKTLPLILYPILYPDKKAAKKGLRNSRNILTLLVGARGFEPPAP
jgi:hypothetical protein